MYIIHIGLLYSFIHSFIHSEEEEEKEEEEEEEGCWSLFIIAGR